MNRALPDDTIAAIATAPGVGGIGVIRVSGPAAARIASAITGRELAPRQAHFCTFRDSSGEVLDSGIALLFSSPHSFTGEDVLELQGHGGSAVLDVLLKECCRLGARLAAPGEFSQRAYLNDKIDLAQAEAIADLINATTEAGVRSANRSLQGEFSEQVNTLLQQVVALRVYVEAAIDFPEEEIDFLKEGKVQEQLTSLQQTLAKVLHTAQQGRLLRDGMKLVIAGRPNAGKSSLLNALSGEDSAIVTPIEGTTRDVLREHIQIDGMPLHIVDTAGLRDSPDLVEQEGINRAWREMGSADHILLVMDASQPEGVSADVDALWPELHEQLPHSIPVTLIHNKCDLTESPPGISSTDGTSIVTLSAQTGLGLEDLKQHLKQAMGYEEDAGQGFMARRRHIQALELAQNALDEAAAQTGYGELMAEDLRRCHDALGEITGAMSADDLLGEIFSSFCIGK